MHSDRFAKASAAFGRLRGSVSGRSGTKLDTKLNVYKAVVLQTLLYACETWTVYQRHAKWLNHFHTSCIRKRLKIRWQDRIPDTEILKKAGIQCTYSSETGTVKMGRQCYQDAWGTFAKENPLWRTRNGQTLPRWSEEAIQRHPENLHRGFQHTNRIMVRNCTGGLTRRGASEYEANRISEAEQKRAQRKARAKASPTELSCSDLYCSICNKQFRARIGLISHLRTHKLAFLACD